MSRLVRAILGLTLVFAAAQGYGQSADSHQYLPGDPDSCMGCHRDGSVSPVKPPGLAHWRNHGDAGSPRSQQGCQSCHGPSARHLQRDAAGKPLAPPVTFNEQTPVEDQNAVCLGCHGDGSRVHWQHSAHGVEEVACSACHTIHSDHDPALSSEDQSALCYGCHIDKRADAMKPSTHPSVTGAVTCSDCHDVHGAAGESLLVAGDVNGTCFQCHGEKRGPFLWEHAPVSESCSNCHAPHGSMHRPMLISATPFLCQQCHLAAFHPSGNYSGDDAPPRGASHNLLYRDCMNCHTKVHGSNHPSGVRFTR